MHPRTPLAAALDTAVVVAFVAIGRRNHDEDEAISGLVETAAPFLIDFARLEFRTELRLRTGEFTIVFTPY